MNEETLDSIREDVREDKERSRRRPCPECGGRAVRIGFATSGSEQPVQFEIKCRTCNGTGYTYRHPDLDLMINGGG